MKKSRLLVLAGLLGLLLTYSLRRTSSQPALTTPTPCPQFGSVVQIDKVRLRTPVTFTVHGAARKETELVVLALRVHAPANFLPRTTSNEVVLVNGIEAKHLSLPIFAPILIVAAPAEGPLPADTLSTVSLRHSPKRHAVDLAAREQKKCTDGDSIRLSDEAKKIVHGTPTRLLDDEAALLAFARELATKLETPADRHAR